MSAAELRQAAETLRGFAQKATPGPWTGRAEVACYDHGCSDPTRPADGACYGVRVSAPSESYFLSGPRHHDLARAEGDAGLIATMHPGVGLALADWLDRAAVALDAGVDDNWPVLISPVHLARLINERAA